MPIFRPFRGLRFVSEHFAESVAPPYDVLSSDDVRKLRASASTNITWIDVPLPEDGDDPYQIAAETLTTWCRSGVLIRDDMQAFTIYRMSFADESGTQRTISGVIGALEVVPEGAGGVLPHERTTPKASTDRLELTIATNANLSPVWGLSRASGLSRLLETPGEHLGRVTVDGVTHTVERVSEPERVAEIEKLVSAADVLIADGVGNRSNSSPLHQCERQRTERHPIEVICIDRIYTCGQTCSGGNGSQCRNCIGYRLQ